MEHIVGQAGLAADAKPEQQRELVLYLMFGCKFTNKVLEMLGPERVANDENMVAMLKSLRTLEISLPDEFEA